MVFAKTAEFGDTVCGIKRPLVPTRLDPTRKMWTETALEEELTEFKLASTLEDEVDALVDMIYFAAGRMHEMGVDGDLVFDEVHRANMDKVRGELSKRPGSKGHDAVKPEHWQPPMLGAALASQLRPKLIVVGHGRHGKDTVAEIMQEEYGLRFTASSLFCAEKVVWPLVRDQDGWDDLLRDLDDLELYNRVLAALRQAHAKLYPSAQACFDDRYSFRELWFQVIKRYCTPKERLAQEILAENDIYCGIRSRDEFMAAWNAGVAHAAIWVEAGKRHPPEDKTSMEIEPWMCTYELDNNGSLEDLRHNIRVLMEGLYAR